MYRQIFQNFTTGSLDIALGAPVRTRWLKGTCHYGGQCRYSHDAMAASSKISQEPIASPPVTRTSDERRSKKRLLRHRRMTKSTQGLLTKFELSTIQKPECPVEIKDFRFVASYNWSDSDKPVIFVPGCPARWNPPSLPYQVARDRGKAFIDQNSYRSPSASFDPLFKAVLTMHPNFDMKSIGLTTDRNSLRKLFRFVSGKVPSTWRIDVDIVEDTMFFTRWEENQFQILSGSRNSQYGHEFEKVLLSYDSNLQQSSGHHRIVRYNLGGIECLVRFEADGYIDDGLSINDQNLDELGQALSGLQIENSTNAVASPPATEVKVIKRGRLVDDNNILELKSRSKSSRMSEIMPQLWISQTSHLFIGWHKEGLIEVEPVRTNMEQHFPVWESKNQEQLSTLVGLITEIKKVAKRAKEGRCMLVCRMDEHPRVVRVYGRKGKKIFLPRGAREECWRTKSQEKRQAQS